MEIDSFLEKQDQFLEKWIGDKVNIKTLSCNTNIYRTSFPIAKIEYKYNWKKFLTWIHINTFKKQLE